FCKAERCIPGHIAGNDLPFESINGQFFRRTKDIVAAVRHPQPLHQSIQDCPSWRLFVVFNAGQTDRVADTVADLFLRQPQLFPPLTNKRTDSYVFHLLFSPSSSSARCYGIGQCFMRYWNRCQSQYKTPTQIKQGYCRRKEEFAL